MKLLIYRLVLLTFGIKWRNKKLIFLMWNVQQDEWWSICVFFLSIDDALKEVPSITDTT